MNGPSPGRRHAAELAILLAAIVWMWLAMMLVHELGHVLAAALTGGRLASVELRPGYLSHTLVEPNPRPAVVLWGGFLVGWITPHLTAPLWRCRRGLVGPTLRAWAAFCLLAGGLYLAIGGTERLTDTGQLVLTGRPLPLLIVIGAVVAAVGYARHDQRGSASPGSSNRRRRIGRQRSLGGCGWQCGGGSSSNCT